MTIRLLNCFVVTVLVAGGSAFGQGYGAGYGGYSSGYGAGCGGGGTHCGREISQADAEGLWAGYCTESCYDFRRQRGGAGRHGCGLGGGQGGSGGCFGYGADCGSCGVSGGRAGHLHGGLHGGHLGGRLGGGFGGGISTAGVGAGNCFGYPGGGFGNCGSCNSGLGDGGCSGGAVGGRGLFGHHGHGLIGHHGRHFGARHSGPFQYLGDGQAVAPTAANCGVNGGYFDGPAGYGYGGYQGQVIGAGNSVDYSQQSPTQGYEVPVIEPHAPNGGAPINGPAQGATREPAH